MPIRLLKHALSRSTAPRGQLRRLARDGKRSFWAFVDQGIVSLGNFGIQILLVNYLADWGSYGRLGFILELMLLLMGLHASLVVYPLTVRGATGDRQQTARLTSLALALTLAASPLIAAIMFVIGYLVVDARVGIWAAFAVVLWLWQVTLRRALMADLRFKQTIVGDSVRYIGQIVALSLVYFSTGELTLAVVFQVIALMSSLAIGVQALQVGLVLVGPREVIACGRDFWRRGSWVLYGNLAHLLTGPLFLWNIAFWVGYSGLGVFNAIYNLLRPAHPLTFAVCSLVVPNVSRLIKESGMRAARHAFYRYALIGVLVLLPYLGLLVVFPRVILEAFYRTSTSHAHVFVLHVLVLSSVLMYFASISTAFLNAIERNRLAFLSKIAHLAGVVFLALPLTALMERFGGSNVPTEDVVTAGIIGAAIGGLLAFGGSALVGLWSVQLTRAEEKIGGRLPPLNEDVTDEPPPQPVVAGAAS